MRSRLAGEMVLTERELEALAWGFLGSEFAGLVYADWTIERRIDAYLARQGMAHVANNGDTYQVVLQRVFANIGPARRSGVLPETTWLTVRRQRSHTDAAQPVWA
jgi:hypothetical protein